jgi:hypothetical protein
MIKLHSVAICAKQKELITISDIHWGQVLTIYFEVSHFEGIRNGEYEIDAAYAFLRPQGVNPMSGQESYNLEHFHLSGISVLNSNRQCYAKHLPNSFNCRHQ